MLTYRNTIFGMGLYLIISKKKKNLSLNKQNILSIHRFLFNIVIIDVFYVDLNKNHLSIYEV